MRIIDDVKLDFKDVLFVPHRSNLNSRSEVDITRTYKFKNSKRTWVGVGIMAANMDGVGTFFMHEALSKHKMLTNVVKHYSLKDWEKANLKNFSNIIPSIGISDKELEHFVSLQKIYPFEFLCVDVANGYTSKFLNFIKSLRDYVGNDITIIAGNVVTPEITEELILNGVDIVKTGIGGGSVCTTRKQTGVGYPQLSAIIECADAAHGLGGHIVSDGGCTCPGDVSKAFGAGADFVMLGGMLAGHDEGGGKIIEENGKKFIEFYGMSSDTAMSKHHGGVAKYRSSEGKTVRISYKGPVEETVQDILGGLRSTMTYIGAKTLKEISKRTTFVRVSQQLNNVFGNS